MYPREITAHHDGIHHGKLHVFRDTHIKTQTKKGKKKFVSRSCCNGFECHPNAVFLLNAANVRNNALVKLVVVETEVFVKNQNKADFASPYELFIYGHLFVKKRWS